MKKIFRIMASLLVVFTLAFAVSSCKKKENKEATYKLGMGVVVSTASSKTNAPQVDATVSSVVLKDGKIVACRIDAVQNKATIADGVYTVKNLETKMELGDRYGMAPAKIDNDGNGVTKEWYDQVKAFEAYVVGMTADEVKNMKTQEKNGHVISADQKLLDAGCSIQITDFIAATVKACNDEQGQEFKTAKEFTLGVAATSHVDASSKNATAEADGAINMYSDFAATVVAEGKILACLNDAIQPKFAFTFEGERTPSFQDTKRCLKEKYGMAPVKIDNDGNGVTKEWFEQSAAFSAYVVGMTADEVKNMKTQEKNGHVISADKGLLDAGCSIQITDIKAVVAKAVANAR